MVENSLNNSNERNRYKILNQNGVRLVFFLISVILICAGIIGFLYEPMRETIGISASFNLFFGFIEVTQFIIHAPIALILLAFLPLFVGFVGLRFRRSSSHDVTIGPIRTVDPDKFKSFTSPIESQDENPQIEKK